jgi:hypothetical protein
MRSLHCNIVATALFLANFTEATSAQTASELISAALKGNYCSSYDGLAPGIKEAAQIMQADYGKGDLPPGWQKLLNDSVAIDNLQGSGRLSIGVYQKGTEIVAAVQGIQPQLPATRVAELQGEAGVWTGGAPSAADFSALEIMSQLKAKYPSISMIGQSKGGGIVNFISNQLQIPGIAFNPTPTNTRISALAADSPVLNIVNKNDRLLGALRSLISPSVAETNPALQVNLACGSDPLCHDLLPFLNATAEDISKSQPEWRGIKCEPKITDPGIMLLCNPLDAALLQVVGNPKLAYTNECNWGVPDKSFSSGFRGERTSIIRCTGWNGIQVITTVPGIPTDARGYAGQEVDTDHTTGKQRLVDLYRGTQFKTACRPPASINPLDALGGCLNLGPIRVGKC